MKHKIVVLGILFLLTMALHPIIVYGLCPSGLDPYTDDSIGKITIAVKLTTT